MKTNSTRNVESQEDNQGWRYQDGSTGKFKEKTSGHFQDGE